MHQTLTALLAVVALLLVHGLIDNLDRNNDDRLAYARFVRESCLPSNEGDRSVAKLTGAQLDCVIVSGGGYGKAQPVIVSAATLEVPR